MNLACVPPNCDMAPVDEIVKDRIYDKIIPLEEGMTVLDLGANIGIFSLYAVDKIGQSGRIIAIEPEAVSFDALKKNTAPYSNIIPLQLAAWNKNGTMTLHQSTSYTGSTLIPSHSITASPLSGKTTEVETVRLDELLPRMGITHVDFVKIDTEGAGNKILEGLEGMMPNIENFAIAAYHDQEDSVEMENYLKAQGFRTKTLHRWMINPYIYATRNPNINLAYVETWQVLLGAGVVAGLIGVAMRKKK